MNLLRAKDPEDDSLEERRSDDEEERDVKQRLSVAHLLIKRFFCELERDKEERLLTGLKRSGAGLARGIEKDMQIGQ